MLIQIKRLIPSPLVRWLRKGTHLPLRFHAMLYHKQVVHILHLGKTGGSALKYALKKHQRTERYIIILHNHRTRLMDIPVGEKVIFVVRDPIKRFVSGFYGRMRMDRPRINVPWTEGERVAFTRFHTPNELGTALSSDIPEEKQAAMEAMKEIGHIRTSYWDWFRDRDYFVSRRADILHIGFLETLDQDFEILKTKLGLDSNVSLPRGDVASHKNPADTDRTLTDIAEKNLRSWFAKDYELIRLCRELGEPAQTM